MTRTRTVYMKPAEYRAILQTCGLSITDAANLLGRNVRTSRHWANDTPITDAAVAAGLRLLGTGAITISDFINHKCRET